MIDEESQRELSLISDLFLKKNFITSNNQEMVNAIAYDAIEEAIVSSGSEEGIFFILQHYPSLTQLLVKIVAEKHPEHLDRLNKLIVLT